MSSLNTAARNDHERKATIFDDLAARFQIPQAGSAINAQRLVVMASDGDVEQATFNSTAVIGVYPGTRALANGEWGVPVQWGRTFVVADQPITAGQRLKSASGGKATQRLTAALSGITIEDNVGLAFTNQPANDGIEVISSSAADTSTFSVTAYYTRTGQGNAVFTATANLNGTTVVTVGAHTDVALVLAWEKSAATTGTITLREASADQTISTLAPGTLSAGKIAVTAGQEKAYNSAPTVQADLTSVKTVGIIGTDEDDAALIASVVLTGTAPVAFPDTFKTVTFILTGDVESTVTVTVKTGAVDGDDLDCGVALSTAAAAGDRLNAFIAPSAPKASPYSTVRTGQEYQVGFGSAKVGADAGWVVAAAANLYEFTLPASQTGSDLIVPISGLKVGAVITGFKVIAQIESAGGAVTLDANLRYLENAAADPTDNSVGSITQVAVTADTASAASATGFGVVVTAARRFYVLISGTTAGSTDIRLLGVTVTVTEP